MRKIIFLFVFLSFGVATLGYGQEKMVSENSQVVDDKVISVYYFHMSRRCATCMAVESESQAALKNLYPKQLESGLITFKEINLEEESNEPLAKKMEVSGQTLLVVKGEKKIDLTGDGFKYARSSPEKLQDSFKAAIDPLL